MDFKTWSSFHLESLEEPRLSLSREGLESGGKGKYRMLNAEIDTRLTVSFHQLDRSEIGVIAWIF